MERPETLDLETLDIRLERKEEGDKTKEKDNKRREERLMPDNDS